MNSLAKVEILVGASYALREQILIQRLQETYLNAPETIKNNIIASLLEGIPTGTEGVDNPASLEALQKALAQATTPTTLIIKRFASACFCCAGSMVFQVHLNAILRQRAQHIYLTLAMPEHAQTLRQVLQNTKYHAHIGEIHIHSLS